MHSRGLFILSVLFALFSCASPRPGGQTTPEPGRHAEEQFQGLADEERRQAAQQPQAGSNEQGGPSQNLAPTIGAAPEAVPPSRSSASTGQDRETQYLVAVGRGDLKKGLLVCERVADTAARAELAKLIRVQIREHATDRVRERSGQPPEQDIEVIREEIANELLQEVKIIDRSIDEAAGTCSSTAVMPKKRITAPGEPSPGAAVK